MFVFVIIAAMFLFVIIAAMFKCVFCNNGRYVFIALFVIMDAMFYL